MNIKHQIWTILGSSPLGLRLIKLYLSQLKNGDAGVVAQDTEIVIEGYPRSANTTAVAAFRIANDCNIKIAHHIHGSAQISRAAKLSIPCILLVRDPMDAAISLCIRDKSISLHQAMANYINYHRRVLPYRNRFVLACFKEVLFNFDKTISEVNQKFNCNFNLLGKPPADCQQVIDEVKKMDRSDRSSHKVDSLTVALPTGQKKLLKEDLQRVVAGNKKLQQDISTARQLLQRLATPQ